MERDMKHMLTVGLLVLAVSCFAENDSPKAGTTDTDVIAVVLGKKITTGEKDKLNGLIFSALLQQYAKDNKIEPSEAELDAFVAKLVEMEKQSQAKDEADRAQLRQQLQSTSLSDQDRKEKESRLQTIERILKSTQEAKEMSKGMEDQMRLMKRQIAQQFVKSWKINKALYAQYGGRVIFQQAEIRGVRHKFLTFNHAKHAFKSIKNKKFASHFDALGLAELPQCHRSEVLMPTRTSAFRPRSFLRVLVSP